MNTHDDLGQKLEALMPKCLDDIVRLRRDNLTIRLATEHEVTALHHEIAPSHAPKMVLHDWRLIAFVKSVDDFHQVDISLLGDSPYGGARITSPVRKLDIDRRLITNQNQALHLLTLISRLPRE
jgi:hypothetical protein